MQLSLYLHFPFCKQKCLYCDFISAPCDEAGMRAYCAALEDEIRTRGAMVPEVEISSVFFGGGTPSLVPPECMESLLRVLRTSFRFLPDAEFSSEANPATLTPLWLETMVKGGMNRLSIGMQAAQDTLLERIGRIHRHRDTVEAVRMARRAGIHNLNLDLMFALPGQSLGQYRESIEAAAELGAEHISAYSLILEEGTPLEALVRQGKMKLPTEEEAAMQYEAGIARLRELGYRRYEISNFAKDGYACRHNLGYWQGAWYMGLGVAASGMLPPTPKQATEGVYYIREDNTKDRKTYLAAAGAWETQRTQTLVYRKDALFETVMLSLRTCMGIDRAAFARRFGVMPEEACPHTTAMLINNGLAVRNEDRFALTDRGLEMQNAVLLRFMEELEEKT